MNEISIPFGAIKSDYFYIAVSFYRISIPFGAIKSNFYLKGRTLVTKFQFLLVRLRAGSKGMVRGTWRISIPFGAIKSRFL